MEHICDTAIELAIDKGFLRLFDGTWHFNDTVFGTLQPETLDFLRYCIASIGSWL